MVNHGWAARDMGAGEPPRPSAIFQVHPRPSSTSLEAPRVAWRTFSTPYKASITIVLLLFFLYFAVAAA
jgi:hypothetical protein